MKNKIYDQYMFFLLYQSYSEDNIIFGILIYNYHSLRITLITYINKRVGLLLHKK